MKDLHVLPRIKDSWSYLYVEHSRIDQQAKGISVFDAKGSVQVPCAMLSLLMLGPGTSITHAAVKTLAENGCMVLWCGEEGVRVYAVGLGETRASRNLLCQVRMHSDPALRLQVVHRMYEYRFPGEDLSGLGLQEIRGREGVRVRECYARASRETGVEWKGREYKSGNWNAADPVNRALSAGNSCLYGLCHAAIVASGYSPALGFIHTGKALSFVYDIADLYKATTVIPAAFRVAAESGGGIEARMRHLLRDYFFDSRLLERIVPDIAFVLGCTPPVDDRDRDLDSDDALPGGLWDPEQGAIDGGVNYSGLER